jgi:hypothetical protein
MSRDFNELLNEALISIQNCQKEGYNTVNWLLNCLLCIEKAKAIAEEEEKK